MNSTKNRLREEILSTKDENIHAALVEFLSVTQKGKLTSEQMEMLSLSEKDIENDNVISNDDLDYLY